jgi:hypothetical protein
VNPWTKYALSLLSDTTRNSTFAGSNLFLAVAQGRLYVSEGNNIRATTAVGGTVMGLCTGTPAVAVTSVCSDGSTTYAAHGASGIFTNPVTYNAFTSHTTGQVDLVRYEKGRLIAASGKKLYNVIASGAAIGAAKLLLDHPNPAWVWTDATSGQGFIYASGYAGDKSMIYRTAVKADGTDLDVPVVAGELPDGETARSITGYLGFLVIGTDHGVRFAAADDAGNLTLGSVIPTSSPVLCGEGQDRFVWYGLTNYDAVSTGLGRLDLSTFTGPLTPAWASDLMSTTQGTVTAVATYAGLTWYCVAGYGLIQESSSRVVSGTLTSGRVAYGIPDTKRALTMGLRHDALPSGAEVQLSLSTNGETPVFAGRSEVDGTTSPSFDAFELHQKVGDFFEWTATLFGTVCVRRIVLRVDPSSDRTELSVIPLLLEDTVILDGVSYPVDVAAEWTFLRSLCHRRGVVTQQERDLSTNVVVEDFTWAPRERTAEGRWFQGTFTVRSKSV